MGEIVGNILAQSIEYLLVLTTCPDLATAKQIAQDLLANKIAACVNIVPGLASYFKWDNKMVSEDELLLLIKTTSTHFLAIQTRIKSLHPYELPEIIAIPIADGLKEYLRWIADSTG